MEAAPPETPMIETNVESSYKTDHATQRKAANKPSMNPLELEDNISSFKRVRLLSKAPPGRAPACPSFRFNNLSISEFIRYLEDGAFPYEQIDIVFS